MEYEELSMEQKLQGLKQRLLFLEGNHFGNVAEQEEWDALVQASTGPVREEAERELAKVKEQARFSEVRIRTVKELIDDIVKEMDARDSVLQLGAS